jgi:hypothetical protein
VNGQSRDSPLGIYEAVSRSKESLKKKKKNQSKIYSNKELKLHSVKCDKRSKYGAAVTVHSGNYSAELFIL